MVGVIIELLYLLGASQTLQVTAKLELKESVSPAALMFPVHYTQPSNPLSPCIIMHSVKR